MVKVKELLVQRILINGKALPSVILRDLYARVRTAILAKKDRETITAVVVYACGGDILTSHGTNIGIEERMESKYISPTHTLVIAVGNEGACVFQSSSFHHELPTNSLEQWIEQGGARLRSESEMNDFLKAFDAL